MKVNRKIENKIIERLNPGKVVILIGARRVGKTFLTKEIVQKLNLKTLYLNAEDFTVQELLKTRTVKNYKNIIGKNELLVIDEAQVIPEIGKILKLMVDEIEGIKILVTGSSAFDLSNKTGEPLTGRKTEFFLFPFSEEEYAEKETRIEQVSNLESRLIYGGYPELMHIEDNEEKIEYLRDLVNSYLLKDIIAFEGIRNSDKIFKLLSLIAHQVGSEVSYEEIGKQLGISKNTVDKYLDLLTKNYILFKLTGFSRNLRKEITKKPKWYFYDNGIRNAIISNFKPISNRNDIGELWESYVISELIKKQSNERKIVNNYFWRTYDQQEIDLIVEEGDKLNAFEIKFNKEKVKVPGGWINNYQESEFNVINKNNYLDYLM
ncbi:MAG: ATP-binding protein [Rhodothermaceae bacterium]